MKKLSTLVLVFTLTAFPQLAMAHFESPHEPFWHEPMHFVIDHYVGLMLIAVGIVAITVSFTRKPHNKKTK